MESSYEEVPHAETILEADVKLENEELKQIVLLKEEIAEKIKLNLIIKAESENQKKMISSSDLRKENYKIKDGKKVNRSGDFQQNHQKTKPRDNFANKFKQLVSISEPVASSKKKKNYVSPKKSSNGYFQSKEFKECWSKISREPFDFSELAASQNNEREEIFHSPSPKKHACCVNSRKLDETLSQTELEDSLNNSSSCSVPKRKSSGTHKRDHEGFLVPLTRVKFTIVTEEKDRAGKAIPSLSCAMRPGTFIRQVKKSYCKKMGLDKDKMGLKLVGDVNQNMICLLDESSITLQGLEGKVVTAVRVKGEEVGESTTEVASKNITK